MRRGLVTLSLCTVLAFTIPAHAQEQSFEAWLDTFRAEAMAKGISKTLLDAAFQDTRPIPQIIKYDRAQPEFTLTLQQYLDQMVPPVMVKWARQRYGENRQLLEKITGKYDVQSRFLVALWGIESRFGRFTGNHKVIDALATLAYDERRDDFFRNELLDALRIAEDGHMELEDMKGSWAGAMGQTQFMPSVFTAYATDYEGDGRVDIWNSKGDVFASSANYLSQIGWRGDETWGRKVTLPKAGIAEVLIGLEVKQPLAAWHRLGVTRANGAPLPKADLEASLITLDDGEGPSYLVYNNFHAILTWNRSLKFAVAVGTLADAIVGR